MVENRDIASIAQAFADPRRVRVLTALADGRALPAGRLAEEAGIAASTASNHLGVLLDLGLVSVVKQGRHRFYRLASAEVEGVLEALSRLAPATPITSLREHTRAHALRTARTCYHHVAGKFGIRVFARFLDSGWITGGDGTPGPDDEISSVGHGLQYRLSESGATAFADWGVDAGLLSTSAPLKYCMDWTEQTHHLAGRLGAAVADRMFDLGWIERGRVPRSLTVTSAGEAGLATWA